MKPLPYNPTETKVIDLTKTTEDKAQELLNMRLALGKNAFNSLVTQTESKAKEIEAQTEAKHKRRIEESEQKRKLEHTPLNDFIASIKVHTAQPQQLERWKQESRQTLETVYNEFTALASRNGIPLDQQDIDFGVGFLNTLRSTSPPQPPHRWIDKIAH